MTQPKYAIKSDVEDYLALSIDAALASYIDSLLTAASDWIDRYTGRFFTVPTLDETRYFDGNGRDCLEIDDVVSITSITVYGTPLLSTDFYLYPANRTPKTSIQLRQFMQRNSRQAFMAGNGAANGFIFLEGQQNVAITGKFGFDDTSVPAAVKTAVLRLVGGIIKEALGDKDVKELTQEVLGDYQAGYAKLNEIANSLKVSDLLFNYCREGSIGRPIRTSVSTGITRI